MNQFHPSPRVFGNDRLEFFLKFVEIFASQGAPPISTTLSANFATGINNIGGIFFHQFP
jgi:hypothetical protein